MTYIATEYFEDMTDKRHKYKAGDVFPRKGLSVSEARLAELSSDGNRRGRPVIASVASAADDQQKEQQQTDNKPTADKPKARRSRKKKE